MPTAPCYAPYVAFLAALACGASDEQAETHRVTLPKTASLPAMTITVPRFLTPPLRVPPLDDPFTGYAMVGSELPPGPDAFRASVSVERYEGQHPDCSRDWSVEKRGTLEVKVCAGDGSTTVRIPHDGGEIVCSSKWHANGELTPVQRAIAGAIDASCSTITIE